MGEFPWISLMQQWSILKNLQAYKKEQYFNFSIIKVIQKVAHVCFMNLTKEALSIFFIKIPVFNIYKPYNISKEVQNRFCFDPTIFWMEFLISDHCVVCKLQFNKFEIDFAQHCDLSTAAATEQSSRTNIQTHGQTDKTADSQWGEGEFQGN